MSNVPDDWNSFWTHCHHCGRRYHESEGGCDCQGTCDVCGHDDGDMALAHKIGFEGDYICETCAACAHCGRDNDKGDFNKHADGVVCPQCAEKEHEHIRHQES
jgi:hypothetical protein